MRRIKVKRTRSLLLILPGHILRVYCDGLRCACSTQHKFVCDCCLATPRILEKSSGQECCDGVRSWGANDFPVKLFPTSHSARCRGTCDTHNESLSGDNKMRRFALLRLADFNCSPRNVFVVKIVARSSETEPSKANRNRLRLHVARSMNAFTRIQFRAMLLFVC